MNTLLKKAECLMKMHTQGLLGGEVMPEYERFGRAAPLKRNITIIENADLVLAFWDGKSRGTKFVIDSCEKLGVEVRVIRLDRGK